MRNTNLISAKKVNNTTLEIIVSYGIGTSYSKSVEPTIKKAFRKYSILFFGGGSWEKNAPIDSKEGESETYTRTVLFNKLT